MALLKVLYLSMFYVLHHVGLYFFGVGFCRLLHVDTLAWCIHSCSCCDLVRDYASFCVWASGRRSGDIVPPRAARPPPASPFPLPATPYDLLLPIDLWQLVRSPPRSLLFRRQACPLVALSRGSRACMTCYVVLRCDRSIIWKGSCLSSRRAGRRSL